MRILLLDLVHPHARTRTHARARARTHTHTNTHPYDAARAITLGACERDQGLSLYWPYEGAGASPPHRGGCVGERGVKPCWPCILKHVSFAPRLICPPAGACKLNARMLAYRT